MIDFDALEEKEDTVYKAIVLHEDAADASYQAASRCIDRLLSQGNPNVAKAVTLFGPGIIVLPMFAGMSGIDPDRCLEYGVQSQRNGVLDRIGLKMKFGQVDPKKLIEELAGGPETVECRLKSMADRELQSEVLGLQDWKIKAYGRLRTLERRAAWAFLGIPAGHASQAAIRRAFKQKALELHPDKGGDPNRFQLLQEMKELLLKPSAAEDKAKEAKKDEDDEQQKEDHEPNGNDEVETNAGDGDDPDSNTDTSDDENGDSKDKNDNADDDDPFAKFMFAEGDFEREKYESARRKLYRSIREMWDRTGMLITEIRSESRTGVGEDAVRQLRKFVDRFSTLELAKLEEGDQRAADGIFRRFLEQGSETICVAGAADPEATASIVAVQVNVPLMAASTSQELRQRCDALLGAIESLPATFGRFAEGVSDIIEKERRTIQHSLAEAAERKAKEEATRRAKEEAMQKQKEAIELMERKMREEAAKRRQEELQKTDKEKRQREDQLKQEAIATAMRAKQASRCRCGTQYKECAMFCHKCGAMRPKMPANDTVIQTTWPDWTNPCAGSRRKDGKAIYCEACKEWIWLREPYKPREFDWHCERQVHRDKAAEASFSSMLHQAEDHQDGEYGWID